MIADVLQGIFEALISFVWERRGPVAGALTGIGIVAAMVGSVYLAVKFL